VCDVPPTSKWRDRLEQNSWLTSSRALLVRSRSTRADAHADSCIHRRPSISAATADCIALRGKGVRGDRDRSTAELEASAASQALGRCKQQSGSRAAGGRAAGLRT